MPLNARTKGKNGEREASYFLAKIVGMEIQRNLSQTRDGGADILDVPGLTIEVKRQEVLLIDRWWAQVCRAADQEGKLPVLMYRQNRKPWSFCLPAMLLHPTIPGRIHLGELEFIAWLKQWLGG